MATSTLPAEESTDVGAAPPPPVMKVTGYDRVSSFLLAAVGGLVIAAMLLGSMWWINRPAPMQELVPLELVELTGGTEDGAIDESWDLESPEDPNPEATAAEEQAEQVQLEEMLDNVVELSDQAAQQVQQQVSDSSENSGIVGSAEGTGKRALGAGPGDGGVPREQRWFINYADDRSLDEYAKQLDYFGIELGALLPSRELVYASNLTNSKPDVRKSASGKDEQRLYMTWQAGERKEADRKLLQKAGINPGGGLMMQFYPKKVEDILATLEFQFQNQKYNNIRRTYFEVEKRGRGYEFKVARQTLFR